jgi:flagellin FlaB
VGRLRARARRFREEEGITGLETAIILIAFVVVAAVFAFVILSTGLFASERGRESVYAGLAKTRGTITISSGVVARANAGLTQLNSIEFDLVLAASGDAEPGPAATANRTSSPTSMSTTSSTTWTTPRPSSSAMPTAC